MNNGTCTPYFELQRGVSQGDPLSPYLFIIAAETLAIAVRSRPDIQGLTIGQEEFKVSITITQFLNFETLCMSKTFCEEINRIPCFVLFLSDDKIPPNRPFSAILN